MKAVIMCGGSGTRLWPVSRKSAPKQFVPLFGEKSLFELTIERNLKLVDEFIIVVNEAQLPLCKKQIPPIIKDKVKYIIEPIGRNTAPAITLAALIAEDDDLLVLASDHLIKDEDIYTKCIKDAQKLSQGENLVTFGITAKYPETGFGYIEADGNDVTSFKEKPDLKTAEGYVSTGNYFWNSGMFFFNAKTYLNELKQFRPEIYEASRKAIYNTPAQDQNYFIGMDDMNSIPEDSIDYAVMEKSSNVKVVPSPFYWSDLGSFDALDGELEKDENGNTKNENYIGLNSHNNLIIGNQRLITTFDINDFIIIDTDTALLIGQKGDSQKVKELLKQVKEFDPTLLD